MAAPSNLPSSAKSALLVEKAIRAAAYAGVNPVIDAAEHPDALASVAAVLDVRGMRWDGYSASWSIHGLSEISPKDDHVPPADPEELPASTAVLSLDVPHYTTDLSLRSITSNAVAALHHHVDDEGEYLADIIVVVSRSNPEGA